EHLGHVDSGPATALAGGWHSVLRKPVDDVPDTVTGAGQLEDTLDRRGRPRLEAKLVVHNLHPGRQGAERNPPSTGTLPGTLAGGPAAVALGLALLGGSFEDELQFQRPLGQSLHGLGTVLPIWGKRDDVDAGFEDTFAKVVPLVDPLSADPIDGLDDES